MVFKKDNSNSAGLWISPPRRWLCFLIPLLVVVSSGAFKNSYVYEQFRYSLREAVEFQSRSFANGASEVPAAFEAPPPAEASVPLERTLRPVEGRDKVSSGDKGQSKLPDDRASYLTAARADLAEPVTAEASAHRGIGELEEIISKASATEWTSSFPTELERYEGMARTEASVRPSSEFTLNNKTESAPNDRGYVGPLVVQTPIPLPRPAPRIQLQTAAADRTPHSANTEQPTKGASKNVRHAGDNPPLEAKQRQTDGHPFGSVFDSVR